MKYFALATVMSGLGLAAIAAPASAITLGWTVEYTGWWEAEGGGSISGMFLADDTAITDGIVSVDEMTSWTWNWSGNSLVPAFSIASGDSDASTDFFPQFYVDGTPNLPEAGLEQGSFISGNNILDLEFLIVSSVTPPFDELVSIGDSGAALGSVTISPKAVPTPAVGIPALASLSIAAFKRRKQNA